MSFFQNTCKPSGLGGRLMVKMMNSGHAKLADWGFSQIQAKADARVWTRAAAAVRTWRSG